MRKAYETEVEQLKKSSASKVSSSKNIKLEDNEARLSSDYDDNDSDQLSQLAQLNKANPNVKIESIPPRTNVKVEHSESDGSILNFDSKLIKHERNSLRTPTPPNIVPVTSYQVDSVKVKKENLNSDNEEKLRSSSRLKRDSPLIVEVKKSNLRALSGRRSRSASSDNE